MLDWEGKIGKIDGLITRHEGEFLYETAKALQSGQRIVEIGSWKGRSTVCLGSGSRDGNGARIIAIDPHVGSSEHHDVLGKVDTFQQFLENIGRAGVADLVTPVRAASSEAAPKIGAPIDFLFIDGAHEKEAVELDYALWFPKVVEGGRVAFHDSWIFWGPMAVTAKILIADHRVKNPRLIDNITVIEKTELASFSDRIRSILFLVARPFVGVAQFLSYGTHLARYFPSFGYIKAFVRRFFK